MKKKKTISGIWIFACRCVTVIGQAAIFLVAPLPSWEQVGKDICIFYHLKVIVTHFKVNNCYCICWQCLWQSDGISSPIRKFENSRHVNHENHTDCGSRKYREQLTLMFRKEVNIISSFVGFSLQSLWSLDLKTWKKKKRAFAAMPMAMEHQETGTLEELGIEFDRF